MITTARNSSPIARKRGTRTFFHMVAKDLGLSMDPRPPIGPPLEARINHGRWLVRCPDCAGAELIDPEDPFFFCLSCGNEEVRGRMRIVVLPAERAEIEAAIEGRKRQHQNWIPGESLAFLAKENAEHERGA